MESKSIFSTDFYSLREKDIKNGENKEGQGIVRNGLDLFRSDALPLFIKEEPVILLQRSERLGMKERERDNVCIDTNCIVRAPLEGSVLSRLNVIQRDLRRVDFGLDKTHATSLLRLVRSRWCVNRRARSAGVHGTDGGW